MRFRRAGPSDLPAPPTADGVTARFGVRLFTFAPQPTLEEWGVGTATQSSDGGPERLSSASLIYTLWRDPEDHDASANMVDLPESTRRMLDEPPIRPMPPWFEEARRRMRHPSLWEAVQTIPVHPEAARMRTPSLEEAVVAHARHIIVNSFGEERTDGTIPPVLADPPGPEDLAPTTIEVDGVPVDGLVLAGDTHVHAVGARIEDRILTAVVPRAELAHVRLAFVTRPASA